MEHCIVAFSGALLKFVTVVTYFNDANYQLQFCLILLKAL